MFVAWDLEGVGDQRLSRYVRDQIGGDSMRLFNGFNGRFDVLTSTGVCETVSQGGLNVD